MRVILGSKDLVGDDPLDHGLACEHITGGIVDKVADDAGSVASAGKVSEGFIKVPRDRREDARADSFA